MAMSGTDNQAFDYDIEDAKSLCTMMVGLKSGFEQRIEEVWWDL